MTSSNNFIRKCPSCGEIKSVLYTDLYFKGEYCPDAMMCCGQEIPYDPSYHPEKDPAWLAQNDRRFPPPPPLMPAAAYNSKNAKNVMEFIQELESVQRFSKNRPIWQENLVYHTGIVATLSIYLLNKMTEEYGEELFSSQQACELMARTVIHDIGEIITGDIIRPTKYATPEISAAINQLETTGVGAVIEKYDLPRIWKQDWAKGKDDEVGLLLKIADAAAVAVTCRRELWLFSNRSFLKTTKECHEYVESLINELTYKEDHADSKKSEFVYSFLRTFLMEINIILRQIIGL